MKKRVNIEYVAPEMEIVSTVVECGFEGSLGDSLNATVDDVVGEDAGVFYWF